MQRALPLWLLLAVCSQIVAVSLSGRAQKSARTVEMVDRQQQPDGTVRRETLVTEEPSDDGPVGSTLGFIGGVIALPFKVVLGIFGVLF